MKQINAEKIDILNVQNKHSGKACYFNVLVVYLPDSLSSNFCCAWLYDTFFFSKDGTAPDEGDFTQKMFMLADNGELDSGKLICEVCSFNLFVHLLVFQ